MLCLQRKYNYLVPKNCFNTTAVNERFEKRYDEEKDAFVKEMNLIYLEIC